MPAFLRNMQADATEQRAGVDRNGYMPEGGLAWVMEAFDQMRRNVAVQVPGVNNEPVVLDPLTGFLLSKQVQQTTSLTPQKTNPWLQAAMSQLLPHAAFKSVKSADYMPVHTELANLRRFHTRPIVFYARANLSTKLNGVNYNLN